MYCYSFINKFKKIVETNKNKIAIKNNNTNQYSYKELDIFSDCIATEILRKKIKINEVIIIDAKKKLVTYAAIIACLKIGCPYVLIDFAQPIERIKKILLRCNSKICLSFFDNKILIKKLFKKHINLDNIKFSNKKFNEVEKRGMEVVSSTPAYIMFTSGSTGFPKGAIITHQNILNFSTWAKEEYKLNSKDVVTNVNPLYFDNSVFDIYSSLLNGLKLIIFNQVDTLDPLKLIQKLLKNRCSVWFSTPSLLIFLINYKLVTKKNFKYIDKIIFGGEGFPKNKLRQLISTLGNKKNFYNVYGPTECTCICSSHKVLEKDFKTNSNYITLGNISKNFQFEIINSKFKRVNKGKVGELLLLGPNVSSGYIGQNDLTDQRFIQNPFNKKFKDIGYRTGDFVYQEKKNNQLFFVGREDSQVKHMGYRIELNEIEIAINNIKNIKEAVVFYKKEANNGKIITVIACNELDKKEYIYNTLKKKLPIYMIPSKIFLVKNLLKNRNNKIDRKKMKDIYEKK